jgi:hypothetical protein
MKYILHGSVISIGLLIISSAFSAPFSSSAEYEAAMQRAEKDYVAARELCDALKNHAQDVCIAEARAERKRQEADAEAAEKNTPEARTKALISYADAELELAQIKCEAYRGNDKDICLKRAQLEHQQSVSVAKANQKVRDAHQKAMEEISEADYELELEKCEKASGDARKHCVDGVKAKYKK